MNLTWSLTTTHLPRIIILLNESVSPLTQGEDGEDKERRNAKTQRSPEGQRLVFKTDV